MASGGFLSSFNISGILEHQTSKSNFSVYWASFDTPLVPGGIQKSHEKNIFDFSLCVMDLEVITYILVEVKFLHPFNFTKYFLN